MRALTLTELRIIEALTRAEPAGGDDGFDEDAG